MNATTDEVNPAEVELISKIMMVGFILGPCFAGCLHWGLTRKQKNRKHFVKIQSTRVEPVNVLEDHHQNDIPNPNENTGKITGQQDRVSTETLIPEANMYTRPNPNGRVKKPNFSVISSV